MNTAHKAARRAFELALNMLPAGAVGVRHADGRYKVYGTGDPYFDVIIRDAAAYGRLLMNPAVAVGECYMDGLIDIDGDLSDVAKLGAAGNSDFAGSSFLRYASKVAIPWENVKARQKQQIAHHYDIGNDFFRLWLDETMTYSCAYFKNGDEDLETAQENKRAHVLRKLRLQPGQRVLEIGSGWGTTLVEAADRYGIHGVGVTLSEEQLRRSRELAEAHGVTDRIEFRLQNYQDISGEKFDAIFSIGMYEHVGRGNGNDYFAKVRELLADDGVSVLHTITQQTKAATQPWVKKYVFPGGYLPANSEILEYTARNNLRVLHSEGFGIHYARTLEEWLRRYEAQADVIEKMFDERFVRMWRYYLATCAGAFRYGGNLDLVQYTFTKMSSRVRPLNNEYMYDAGEVRI